MRLFGSVAQMYSGYSDEKLIELIASDDKTAFDMLISRYKGLVRSRARKFFLTGGDMEDLVQEGMIGLYKAVKDYKSDKSTKFSTFAFNCVNKMILSAVKKDTTLKNRPLNNAVSLADFKGSSGKREDSPEEIVIGKEDEEEMLLKLSKILSGFEYRVIKLYMDGLSHAEMSEALSRDEKAIDNALTRAKQKIKKSFEK